MMELFSPKKIGTLELKNRIVMPPMYTAYTQNGYVTDRMLSYYAERAKGGVGLIIVEATCISQSGKTLPLEMMISDDKFIPGLRKLAETIKGNGAKAAIQIQHGGIKTSAMVSQIQPVGPSGISDDLDTVHALMALGPGPRALTVREIHDLELAFAEAARRAKEAGFDAVELQCSHSFLIDQFISPRLNQREDIYGGSLENRARFACETIECIKKTVGRDYPLICRMTGDEYVPGGITLEDAKRTARLLAQAGADCLHVSVWITDNMVTAPPMSIPKGCFVHLAEGVKEAVDIPVIAVGRIKDPLFAEQILVDQKADLVAMGRALITDPFLPEKTEKGKTEDIIPCISCNQGCLETLMSGLPITCLVNPSVGRESEFIIKPTKNPKRVLIAGAGPAGMEAARVLAMRGHTVVMHEKQDILGGQWNLAWIPPHKGEIKASLDYYERQIKGLNIEITFGSKVTPDLIRKERPDVVVVATGATANMPEIPGVNQGNVLHAFDVLKEKVKVGQKVIVLGSRRVAMETAEFLYEKGKDVTIVARASAIGLDIIPTIRNLHGYILRRFAEKEIKVITNALLKKIQEKGVSVDIGGKEEFLTADSIIFAWGSVSKRSLIKGIEELAPELGIEVYVAGDCIEPRQALEAIYEGAFIGRMV